MAPLADPAVTDRMLAVVAPDGPTLRRLLRALREYELTVHKSVEQLLASDGQAPQALVLDFPDPPSAQIGPLMASLADAFPASAIVLLAGDHDGRGVRRALAAGASGVICREQLETALVPCLRAVFAGQVCVSREHRRELSPSALSTREKQILGLVVMGLMNSQIADRLFLAESTVKSHLHSAFGKLGVRSRNEAVSMILDPAQGLGIGILGVGAEPLRTVTGVG
jgi:DNA-binding NarL/FixJ family response regulator